MSTDYHLQSLAFTMVCVTTMTLLCLVPSAWRFPSDYRASLRSWILGTALVVLSDVIFVARVDSPFIGSLLVLLVGIGCAEWLHAIRLFGGWRNRLWWPYLVVAAGMTGLGMVNDYRTLTAISSMTLTPLYLALMLAAAKLSRPAISVGRTALVATFAIITLVMLLRVGFWISGVTSGAAPGYTNVVRGLLFVLASIGPVTGSLAFVLMCNDHLGEDLRRLATIDSLTGIHNRRSFMEHLERAQSSCRRRKEPLALLVLDLDHFKHINDTAGHPAGDAALIAVSQVIEHALRAEDVLGRIGGEEFAIAAPGADIHAAITIAERIRNLIEHSAVAGDSKLSLTVSIGVAISGDQSADIRGLMQQADEALYEAKKTGRNRVCSAAIPV